MRYLPKNLILDLHLTVTVTATVCIKFGQKLISYEHVYINENKMGKSD